LHRLETLELGVGYAVQHRVATVQAALGYVAACKCRSFLMTPANHNWTVL